MDALRIELPRLPEKEREALVVVYLEERRVREAAGLLGLSEKALESRLYRGRQLLRESLDAAASREGGQA